MHSYNKFFIFGIFASSFSSFSMAESIDEYLVLAKTAATRGDYLSMQNAEAYLKSTVFNGYPFYWWATKNAAVTDDEKFINFLGRHENSLAEERTRAIFLKSLGSNKKWSDFREQIDGLTEKDLEIKCYESNSSIALTGNIEPKVLFDLNEIVFNEKKIPEGCYSYIHDLFKNKIISESDLWVYIRRMLSNNQVGYAKRLSELTATPISQYLSTSTSKLDSRAKVESFIFNVQKSFGTNFSQSELDKILSQNAQYVTASDVSYIWGRFALFLAKRLKSEDALIYFNKSDQGQLNDEQWAWWARSALRVGRWDDLLKVIEKMPSKLSDKPDWQYWKARALKYKNKNSEASVIFNKLKSMNVFNYYSLLSQDEFSSAPKENNFKSYDYKLISERLISKPEINRALTLLRVSINKNDPSFREDAKREWRFAMKNLNDEELLSASEIARRYGFYEMAIYSAEKTNQIHDKSLRYLTPYKEFLENNANAVGLSQSWVYGLIRQESRFVNVARSGVGASGLMQLMPATAKWVAGKVGIGAFNINDINTNIKLGTWYLSHVTDTLGHPVLATAAYNAGPGRAKSWQANRSLEGAIYAETIPFDETRDYVKKVMSNTVIYDSMLNNKNMRLKDILGSIPAR